MRRTSSYPVWYTPEILSLLKLKEYYRRRWRRSNVTFYQIEFRRLRRLTKQMISDAYTSFTNEAEQSLSSDPRSFWNYIRQRTKTSRLPGEMTCNHSTYTDPNKIVNAFADQFSAIFNSDAAYSLVDEHSMYPPVVIADVSEQQVFYFLKRLPNKFTSGDDDVPAFVARDCSAVFATPLHLIINLSLRTCSFPKLWKRSRIVPVFKHGKRSSITDYRPISLLSNFAKVFEQVIYTMIYPQVHSFVSPNQHGFIKNRSTITNLAVVTEVICETLDGGGQMDVVYTDFSKAFDMIHHDVLLNKLSAFGFSPKLMKLFASYLSNRTNYVQYNGYVSREFTAKSGVPQGSNLGPLLFVIFLNDLLDKFSSSVLAYADDLKLFRSIASDRDVVGLQSDLDLLVEWCNHNQLRINTNKCSVVTFTRKVSPLPSTYYIDGVPLQKLSSVRDLGVIFDSKLSFLPHIEDVVSSAARMLGLVLRTSTAFTNISVFTSLYQALVLSKMEYGSVIWSPLYTTHRIILERIQRRFLKYLSFRLDGVYPVRGLDYASLLQRHSFMALDVRRDDQSVKFLVKLVQGGLDCSWLLERVSFAVPARTKRNYDTFYLRNCRTNILANSPVQRMCDLINKRNQNVFA